MAETYKPTKEMKTEADRALAWVAEGKQGGTRIGKIRANQISKRENLSRDVVMRMYSFFSRHEKNKMAEGFEPGEQGYPSPGRVAWGLWGGDAGFVWSKNIRDKIVKDEQQNKAIKHMEIIKRELTLIPRNGYENGEHEGKEYEQETPQDIYTFVVSTPEIDRYGTIIVPAGIDYTAYLGNPVVLLNHDADELPVGRCLGFALNGENLEATLQIHRLTDDACEVADLVKAGYVKAVSVGIIPLEWEEKTIDGETVTIYTKSELVEFSIVSIPANRQALLKKSAKTNIKQIFKKLSKVKRMLTPEQTAAINEQFLPVLIDAATTFLRDELGIAETDAVKAAEAGAIAAGDAMLTVLNGDAPELEPTTEPAETMPAAEPMPTENEPATVAASFQTRAGKKISATTYGMILEGLQMITEGKKKIDAAIAERSIEIKPAKKMTDDEIFNLVK